MPRYVLPVLILAVVAVALLLTWLTLGRSASSGSETAVAEQDLAPFRRIDVAGAAEVILQKGATEHMSVETPARGVRIRAEVQGSTLSISAHDSRRWWSSIFGHGGGRAPRITITYRTLEAMSLAGAVKVSATALESPEFRLAANGGSSVRIDGLKTSLLRVSGAGALKAELAGEATEQRISISGAGEYDAQRLASRDATVSVSGVGHVIVRVEKTLSASISGAGNVEYYGNPEVKEHVSGVGRVKRREAARTVAPRWHVASWPLGGALQNCIAL